MVAKSAWAVALGVMFFASDVLACPSCAGMSDIDAQLPFVFLMIGLPFGLAWGASRVSLGARSRAFLFDDVIMPAVSLGSLHQVYCNRLGLTRL